MSRSRSGCGSRTSGGGGGGAAPESRPSQTPTSMHHPIQVLSGAAVSQTAPACCIGGLLHLRQGHVSHGVLHD